MSAEHALTRQIRLPEVGVLGQARLSSATLEVRGRDGSLPEVLYLHRAGIERLTMKPNLPARPFQLATLFRHAVTRRLGAGAWRALSQMREILGIDSDLR